MDAYSRRRHLQHWTALSLAACAPPLWSQQVNHSERRLRVLAWPGYAEPEVIKSFERLHGVKVELTTIDTDEALWQRISARNADDFDVFAINTAELQRCIHHGLVRPVPTERVSNLSRQLSRFQQVSAIAGLAHDGLTMAIPFTYSEIGLIYDAKAFAEPPASITELWAPRLKGRVLVHNSAAHSFSLAAQAMGLASPFNLSSEDWPKVVDSLIGLRRNVAAFYTQPQESLVLFKQRQAVLMLANYGSQQLQLFRQAGLSVSYTIPQEGALAWLDCWAIARGAHDVALAAAWVDHLLGEQASALLVSRQGLASTTAERQDVHASDRLIWLEPVEDDERRNRLWGRIVSGDRFAKVMAP